MMNLNNVFYNDCIESINPINSFKTKILES